MFIIHTFCVTLRCRPTCIPFRHQRLSNCRIPINDVSSLSSAMRKSKHRLVYTPYHHLNIYKDVAQGLHNTALRSPGSTSPSRHASIPIRPDGSRLDTMLLRATVIYTVFTCAGSLENIYFKTIVREGVGYILWMSAESAGRGGHRKGSALSKHWRGCRRRRRRP